MQLSVPIIVIQTILDIVLFTESYMTEHWLIRLHSHEREKAIFVPCSLIVSLLVYNGRLHYIGVYATPRINQMGYHNNYSVIVQFPGT